MRIQLATDPMPIFCHQYFAIHITKQTDSCKGCGCPSYTGETLADKAIVLSHILMHGLCWLEAMYGEPSPVSTKVSGNSGIDLIPSKAKNDPGGIFSLFYSYVMKPVCLIWWFIHSTQ